MSAGRVVGAAMLAAGLACLIDCFLRFALEGRGTPAPVAPPDSLVVSGPYRHTRNPMYVSVITTLIGQTLLFGSLDLLRYTVIVWALAHLWVLIYEEPTLRRQFGASCDVYGANVPRWLPRLRPWTPTRETERAGR